MGQESSRLQHNLDLAHKPDPPARSPDYGVQHKLVLPFPDAEIGVHLVWLLHTQLLHPLSTNILREIYSYLLFCDSLAWITTIYIKNYNFRTRQIDPAIRMERTVRCDFYSRWTMVDSQRMVLCGGGPGEGWKTAYLLQNRGSVQLLPDMQRGRRACALAVWGGSVHAFGSVDSSASERLSLTASTWEDLPDMHTAKWNFNATVWRNAIYLCQGTIDVFDGRDMRETSFQLPEAGNTISCACGPSLLIVSPCYLVVLEMRDNGPYIAKMQGHEQVMVSSHPTPVLYHEELIGFENGIVCRYSLANGSRLE